MISITSPCGIKLPRDIRLGRSGDSYDGTILTIPLQATKSGLDILPFM